MSTSSASALAGIQAFAFRMLRLVLRIAFGLLATVFALVLLLAALIFFVGLAITSLVTGRRPSPAVVFGQFQRYSPQAVWRPTPRGDTPVPVAAGEIVDVEVREIDHDRRQR